MFREYNSTFWKIGRLKTFENWPFQSSDNSCNPERMAAAGFYVVDSKKESDLVECFICSKQLDSWDPDDDPWYIYFILFYLIINYGMRIILTS